MSILKIRLICSSQLKHFSRQSACIVQHDANTSKFLRTYFLRHASTQQESGKKVVPRTPQKDGQVSTEVKEKVKQAGKDATYTGIVIAGLGVTGLMFYAIGRELFSGDSPSVVYGKALKDCINNTEVSDTLGDPIKGYGEMSSRGRRRHVSHSVYEVEGVKHMRMKFYIEGPFRKGTVHLEVKKNESGKNEYRYLFVELDGYPSRTIIVQDNR